MRDTPTFKDSDRAITAGSEIALKGGSESRAKAAQITTLPSSDKPSIVSEGFTITGDLHSNGILHVEGKVSGTVEAHSVNISVTGEIQGEVSCSTLNIKGHMLGTAVCDELVLASSAHVRGNISYRFLTIGSGARVEGDLKNIPG